MPVKISATIEGEKQVSALLEKGGSRLSNMRKPLAATNLYLRKEIDSNFGAQGTILGSKWQPLNATYAAQKRRRYGSKPILEATGKMRKGFKSSVSPRRLVIKNDVKYFRYHQSNRPRRILPRRPMLNVSPTQQSKIYQIFNKFLQNLL